MRILFDSHVVAISDRGGRLAALKSRHVACHVPSPRKDHAQAICCTHSLQQERTQATCRASTHTCRDLRAWQVSCRSLRSWYVAAVVNMRVGMLFFPHRKLVLPFRFEKEVNRYKAHQESSSCGHATWVDLSDSDKKKIRVVWLQS